MPNSAQKESPDQYFVADLEQQGYEENFSDKLRPAQDKMHKGLIKAWPTINRSINTVVYYAIKIIRSAVRVALSQLRNG